MDSESLLTCYKEGKFDFWSEREDLNLRPPQPHCGALPGCATLRHTESTELFSSVPSGEAYITRIKGICKSSAN